MSDSLLASTSSYCLAIRHTDITIPRPPQCFGSLLDSRDLLPHNLDSLWKQPLRLVRALGFDIDYTTSLYIAPLAATRRVS